MADKNQPSKTGTGHGSRSGPGGGTSYHTPKPTPPTPPQSGRTGNTGGGGSKRSKP